MDSRAGEDLSWWWRGWFFARGARLDLTVTRAVPVAGEPRRLHLELANRGRLIMPAVLELHMAAGGVPDPLADHAGRIVELGLSMLERTAFHARRTGSDAEH